MISEIHKSNIKDFSLPCKPKESESEFIRKISIRPTHSYSSSTTKFRDLKLKDLGGNTLTSSLHAEENLKIQHAPKLLFLSKEDNILLGKDLVHDISLLKTYYERKLEALMIEVEDLKSKVKMEKSLGHFVENFDLINAKLCAEIDIIKSRHKNQMIVEKDKFEKRMHDLKNHIYQKIILYRDQTREQILNGSTQRELVDKLQIKALVEELEFASDSYEALYCRNKELETQMKDKDTLLIEESAKCLYLMKENSKLNENLRELQKLLKNEHIKRISDEDSQFLPFECKIMPDTLRSEKKNEIKKTKQKLSIKDMACNPKITIGNLKLSHGIRKNSSIFSDSQTTSPDKALKTTNQFQSTCGFSKFSKLNTESISLRFSNEIHKLKFKTKPSTNFSHSNDRAPSNSVPFAILHQTERKNRKYAIVDKKQSILDFLRS